MSRLYSSKAELAEIAKILRNYLRMPFAGDNIPGALFEAILAHVRKAEVLNNYDFIDVVSRKEKVGWQVKSTKESTPLTWKRAKIEGSSKLIIESEKSKAALQDLGNRIIEFCNKHVRESFQKYELDQIGYARLVLLNDNKVLYFERILCASPKHDLFCDEDFEWHWSTPKKTTKKEQLPALHGYHKKTDEKWFSWHGRGENQLHFTGERGWWPAKDSQNSAIFNLPTEKLSFLALSDLLEKLPSK